METTSDWLARRSALITRYDELDARWPQRGDDYAAALAPLVAALEALAIGMDAPAHPATERSKSWRYVGDGWFDLARGSEAGLLARAEQAYTRAEALLPADAPVRERAVHDFNFANILRGLAAGRNRALMEEADLRYRLAIAGFERSAPQHVAQARATQATLKTQLDLLGAFESLEQGTRSLQAIGRELEAGGDDPQALQRAQQALAAHRATMAGAVTAAKTAVAGAAMHGIAGDGLGAMIDQVQQAAGESPDPALRLLPQILQLYRQQAQEGTIGPARQQMLEPLLKELVALVSTPADPLAEQVDRMGRLRGLMRRLAEVLATPSGDTAPPAGTRAAQVHPHLGRLAQHLAGEQAQAGLTGGEREAGAALFARLAQARPQLPAADAALALALEHDVLRPLAAEVGALGRRHHLMLADPLWGVPPAEPDANAVLLRGPRLESPAWADTLRALRLEPLRPASGAADAGLAAWQALWRCRVAVFDLGGLQGSALAGACYEIGLAFALGRRIVLLAHADDRLPFDLEIEPLRRARGAPIDAQALVSAIDDALYAPPARESGSSVAATVEALHRRAGPAPGGGLRHLLAALDEAAADPVRARPRAETVLRHLPGPAPALLLPTWPGSYPSPGRARLFHVMPFGPAWADAARDAARRACTEAGADYVRGDEPDDARIVRSIWDEIGRATHVLVDLSGFNANVALELGLVHALGRRCRVVANDGAEQRLFPAIAKLRVQAYRAGDGPSLAAAVQALLQA